MPDPLDAVLDAIPATIFLYQPDQILYANRTAAVLMGNVPGELRGLSFTDVFEEPSEANAHITYLKTRFGKIAVTLTDEEIDYAGERVHLITALQRNPLKNTLPDVQRLFETIFESTFVGIAIFDENALFVSINHTYCAIYGYSSDELIGHSLTTIVPPETQAQALEMHSRVIRGEVLNVSSEWTAIRKDGRRIEIVAFNNRMVTETGERFRIVAVIDITEQKQTQRALKASEERLNSILNSMGDAVWSISAETYRLVYANPAIETLTGYSVSEFMEREELLFEIVHPDDREFFREQIGAVLTGKRIDIEHRIIRRDGAIRWIYKRFWLIRSPEGDQVSGLMTDITDRRLAAEQAIQLNLENERVRILSDFVRDASHEFRTPLAVINMRLELMERTRDPEQHWKYIQRIKGQTDRILKLVEALILMSHLDNTTAIQLEQVDLNQMLRGMENRMHLVTARRDLTLTFDLSSEPLYLLGDMNELVHALNAIFDNAVTFTPAGGQIEVRSYRFSAAEVAVEIIDSGIGIAPADLPHVFERFYRVDQSHSTEGFGLGLPIARRVIELHQGRIEIETAPKKGSRFRLIFPANDDPADDNPAALPSPS